MNLWPVLFGVVLVTLFICWTLFVYDLDKKQAAIFYKVKALEKRVADLENGACG
jgi:hypothetical protein